MHFIKVLSICFTLYLISLSIYAETATSIERCENLTDQKQFYCYEQLARQGAVEAQLHLAQQQQYSLGNIVKKDTFKALYWYQKAAEQNNAHAQYQLASMYYSGEGTQEDKHKAFYWHQKAAEQDYAYAQYQLAVLYYSGQGIGQDKQKARYWFQKAEEQGFLGAKDMLQLLFK